MEDAPSSSPRAHAGGAAHKRSRGEQEAAPGSEALGGRQPRRQRFMEDSDEESSLSGAEEVGAIPGPMPGAPTAAPTGGGAQQGGWVGDGGGASFDQDDEEDLDMGGAEFSDTMSAIKLLAAKLHANGRFATCPLIMRHQLYTVLDDASGADMELERHRRQNVLRHFKMKSQADDVALLPTSTYTARISACRDHPSASAERREALELLLRVVAQVTNLSVSMDEMASHYVAGNGKGKATGKEGSSPAAKGTGPNGGGGKPSPSSSSQGKGGACSTSPGSGKGKASLVDKARLEALIQELVRAGFLIPRRDGSFEQMYWFSVPEAGRIAASIPHGRQAILAAIKRSRYKEVLDKNVDKLRWGKSELTPAFHIADLVGAGEIVELSMSAGKFYRLNV